MEDYHCCHAVVERLSSACSCSFFGVFDGHGGASAAELASQRLLPAILAQSEISDFIACGGSDPRFIGEAMRKGFLQFDVELRAILKSSGTTAVCIMLTQSHIICANAGDSRAVFCKKKAAEVEVNAPRDKVACRKTTSDDGKNVLCSHPGCIKSELASKGVDFSGCVEKSDLLALVATSQTASLPREAIALSQDHKPGNLREKARITAAGGHVARGSLGYGPLRVDGVLAVSRGLGDFLFKDPLLAQSQQKVSAEPDVTIYTRQPECDELLILACDGIWDVMNNYEACEIVYNAFNCRPMASEDDIGEAVEILLDDCLDKGSQDNMTAIVVAFPASMHG